jgi:nucleoside-diphosphate-sugar epimerase
LTRKTELQSCIADLTGRFDAADSSTTNYFDQQFRVTQQSTTMSKRIFLAGAAGAIGRRLCLLLVQDGWQVTGTTRSAEKAALLRQLGVEPAIVDVYDAMTLRRVMAESVPEIVIHQLTDLPPGLDPKRMGGAPARNARLREIGTANLIAAAVSAQARRLIVQSIAFAYAPGPKPYAEAAPLNLDASGEPAVTARGVDSMERQTLAAPLESVVLRYGKLYGPGTGFDRPSRGGPLHVDAAADAVRRALSVGHGVYNIAEDDGTVSSAKAVSELGWSAAFRIG